MDVKDAILKRRAIRAFQADPVSGETIRDVLQLATRAVSAVNAQPWEIAVITGDVLEKIKDDNMECVRDGIQADNPFPSVPDLYRRRGVEVAKQLFAAMDIAREDREKRNWWGQRGYRFFDAPAGIILYMDRELDTEYFRFDIGCLVQNLCIAAMEYGLGTCVAQQPVEYERGLRRYLELPANKKVVCGIAIGYPDWNFPANHVISEREELEHIVNWYGFQNT